SVQRASPVRGACRSSRPIGRGRDHPVQKAAFWASYRGSNLQGFYCQNTKPCETCPTKSPFCRDNSDGWELFRADSIVTSAHLRCAFMKSAKCRSPKSVRSEERRVGKSGDGGG